MKILGLSRLGLVPYEDPCGYGGRAFQKPVEALVEMGCEVKMIAPVPWTPFPLKYVRRSWNQYSRVKKVETLGNVEVYHPRVIIFPRSLLMEYAGMFMYHGIKNLVSEIHNKFTFDLIHAHNAIPEGLAGAMLAKIYRIPLVVTVRGTDIDIVSKQNSSCFNAVKTVLETANTLITPSPRLAKSLYEAFSIPSNTICNGLDLDEVLDERTFKKIDRRFVGKIILSVSELTLSKGIDLNICAVKELIDQGRKIHYIIVGDGPYRKALEELVSKFKLENHVEFVGTLQHQEAMGYFSQSDIFSMPSWQETFGLVYLEAMAQGKPVIGCQGQGMDTIITDNRVGLLAKPRDVNTLVGAFVQLLDNPDQALEMGKRGRDLVIKQFTHKGHAIQTMQLYEEVLNESCHHKFIHGHK